MEILIGLCAMQRKIRSKPMQKILTEIKKNGNFKFIEFEEDLIKNKPIEEWPVCHGIIAFFSEGFPIEKVNDYIKKTGAWSPNDMSFQRTIMSRDQIYDILKPIGVRTPKHLVLDTKKNSDKIIETEDYFEFEGTKFEKPFVEKPLDAEDHHVHIYLPTSQGGGSIKLFRKREVSKDRVSETSTDSKIRRTGVFVYEEFIDSKTGCDIKIYAVGKNYAYSEVRNSPFRAQKIELDEYGREIRDKFELTEEERMFASKIVEHLHQNVCGFDVLRDANGKSFVIDINGWSFVKSEIGEEYFANCGKELATLFKENCKV
ncbi:inositol hexakisphosphate and diphosphoinositol-pentakisphosphate kinase [Anaeramoeba ignava]|uniref:Inositol hexakisphosphate and diphosphoinositol-pentakisphosphate kinase n=1 Tax=Anaeramoeba ignava TaxID=1746090 RepID=A0A9Q0LL95_ANAIG|nr:inositol hexakisphosphate and diphosphoinositol-pentakisphosphate kinase [Anaeramoeba ignava]